MKLLINLIVAFYLIASLHVIISVDSVVIASCRALLNLIVSIEINSSTFCIATSIAKKRDAKKLYLLSDNASDKIVDIPKLYKFLILNSEPSNNDVKNNIVFSCSPIFL